MKPHLIEESYQSMLLLHYMDIIKAIWVLKRD